MTTLERISAIVYFSLVYIVLPIVTLLAAWIFFISANLLILIAAALAFVVWLLEAPQKVKYDSSTLNSIRIEEAPIGITRLLSETTNRGVLIHQAIIRVLAEKSHISQTELYDELQLQTSSNLLPSKEMVRKYIENLEQEDIIKNVGLEVAERKKKAYVLTKKGNWCNSAIRKYYPTYRVSFILRNLIKSRLRKKLPLFDSIPA